MEAFPFVVCISHSPIKILARASEKQNKNPANFPYKNARNPLVLLEFCGKLSKYACFSRVD
jgi:hypothetical protein